MRWYRKVLTQYADFTGRASRAEYWVFAVINYCIATVLALFFAVSGPIILTVAGPGPSGETVAAVCVVAFFGLLSLYALAVFLPGLAVTVRRLHDTDRSGLWTLVSFVPFVGSIVLLVLLVLDGTRGPNRYGPDPEPTPGPLPGLGRTAATAVATPGARRRRVCPLRCPAATAPAPHRWAATPAARASELAVRILRDVIGRSACARSVAAAVDRATGDRSAPGSVRSYQQRSLPDRTNGTGLWPLTATTVWNVTWTGTSAGAPVTGTQTLRLTTETGLAVGEVQVLVADG